MVLDMNEVSRFLLKIAGDREQRRQRIRTKTFCLSFGPSFYLTISAFIFIHNIPIRQFVLFLTLHPSDPNGLLRIPALSLYPSYSSFRIYPILSALFDALRIFTHLHTHTRSNFPVLYTHKPFISSPHPHRSFQRPSVSRFFSRLVPNLHAFIYARLFHFPIPTDWPTSHSPPLLLISTGLPESPLFLTLPTLSYIISFHLAYPP